MLKNGFVKLHRKLLDWRWYDDPVTFKVFVHLLLTVNLEDDHWHDISVPKGSRVTSYPKLSQETKLTIQQIRTALKHLESTGEITKASYSNCSVITVVNWASYQTKQQSNQQAINKQSNRRLTGDQQQNKNNKEYKEDKKSAAALVSPSAILPGETAEEAWERIKRLAE